MTSTRQITFVAKRQERLVEDWRRRICWLRGLSFHNLDCVQQVTDLVPVRFRAYLGFATSPAIRLRLVDEASPSVPQ